jgi:hypothetical protein
MGTPVAGSGVLSGVRATPGRELVGFAVTIISALAHQVDTLQEFRRGEEDAVVDPDSEHDQLA